MKQPYNTALYMRLSRDDELQGDSSSILTQRLMLRGYAQEQGMVIVNEYVDATVIIGLKQNPTNGRRFSPIFSIFGHFSSKTDRCYMKLVVYVKGKNAKKFRKNLEYGSARWGTREDIAPFVDPVFENNIILTQTESLMMSNRPKDPRNARNKNVARCKMKLQ